MVLAFSLIITAITQIPDSHATNGHFIISNKASCEAKPIFGIWDQGTKTCDSFVILRINSTDTLRIGSDITYRSEGPVLVNGTIVVSNGATLDNLSGFILVNLNGNVINHGTFNNDPAGFITFQGKFINHHGAIFKNSGTFNTLPSGVFTNWGVLSNVKQAPLFGGGIIFNYPTGNITFGSGAFVDNLINKGSVTVLNSVVTTNNMTNAAQGSIMVDTGAKLVNQQNTKNFGIITVQCNGIFSETGTIIGNPPVIEPC